MESNAEKEELSGLVVVMRSLNRAEYFKQDVLTRIAQTQVVIELESIDAVIWEDDGCGVHLSDILHDAAVEIRRLRRSTILESSV